MTTTAKRDARLDEQAGAALKRLDEILAGLPADRRPIGEALAWAQLEQEVGTEVWERARELMAPEPEPEPSAEPELDVDLKLGASLRYFRERAGLTQAELAERADISTRSIVAYEADGADPQMPQLRRLLKGLGVTAGELFGARLETAAPDGRPGGQIKMSRFRRASGHDSFYLIMPVEHARTLPADQMMDTTLYEDGSIRYTPVDADG